MLVREKHRLQAEDDQRLERAVGSLHRLGDDGSFQGVDRLTNAIPSLVTGREVLRKAPTWPWSPQAFGVLATAVLLPIVV